MNKAPALTCLKNQRGRLGEPWIFLQFRRNQNRQKDCARSQHHRLSAFSGTPRPRRGFERPIVRYPMQITNLWPEDAHLNLAWMSYVAAALASLFTPPPTAIAERTPQGGLLLSATQETFRVDNPRPSRRRPRHPQSAGPFEALPWPPDATLE